MRKTKKKIPRRKIFKRKNPYKFTRNLYDILGVDKSSDLQTIKRAYRKLQLQYQQEAQRFGTNSDKLQEINAAYEILSDSELRRSYDLYGTTRGKQFIPESKSNDVSHSGRDSAGYGDPIPGNFKPTNYEVNGPNSIVNEEIHKILMYIWNYIPYGHEEHFFKVWLEKFESRIDYFGLEIIKNTTNFYTVNLKFVTINNTYLRPVYICSIFNDLSNNKIYGVFRGWSDFSFAQNIIFDRHKYSTITLNLHKKESLSSLFEIIIDESVDSLFKLFNVDRKYVNLIKTNLDCSEIELLIRNANK